MSQEALERREKALDREIAQWKSNENHRRNLVAKLEAQIEVLSPKAAMLQQKATAAQARIDRLSTQERGYLEATAVAKHASDQARAEVLTALANRDAVLEEIAGIEANKQVEINAYESTASKQAESRIKKYNELVEEAQKEQLQLNNQVMESRQEAQVFVDEAEITKENAIKAKTDALEQISATKLVIKAEEDRAKQLQIGNGELIEQNKILTEQNHDLITKNDDFLAYERRALKILEAKDQELLKREAVLEQREHYKPRLQSLLPPQQ